MTVACNLYGRTSAVRCTTEPYTRPECGLLYVLNRLLTEDERGKFEAFLCLTNPGLCPYKIERDFDIMILWSSLQKADEKQIRDIMTSKNRRKDESYEQIHKKLSKT